MRILEDALEWHPEPGERALDPDELAAMRTGLNELLPSLLARIRTERTNTTDLRVLREFVDRVEPVESLTLSCALDGETVAGLAARPYFVQVGKGAGSLQAFVVWDAADWLAPDTGGGAGTRHGARGRPRHQPRRDVPRLHPKRRGSTTPPAGHRGRSRLARRDRG